MGRRRHRPTLSRCLAASDADGGIACGDFLVLGEPATVDAQLAQLGLGGLDVER